MKQNIETMWKHGFLADEDLIAPKINNLYNTKSQQVVEKFHNQYVLTFRTIVVASLLVFAVFVFWGVPYLAIFILCLCMMLAWQCHRSIKQLEQLDNSIDSYHYLKAFQCWLVNQDKDFTAVYRYFYSLLFVSFFIQWRFSETASLVLNQLTRDFPNMPIVLDTPIYLLALVITIASLLFKFGGVLYKADTDLVYGRTLKKLEELIREMEELRK